MAETCVMTEETKKVAPKLVYLLKRLLDEWMGKKLCRIDQPGFNSAHLPLFMSIGKTGISNNELAAKMNVSKQATSKMVKELEAINMVRSEKSPDDARVVMLYFTTEGEAFYYNLKNQVMELENQYKKVVGNKNYEIAIEVMLKLVKFHEETNCIEDKA
ncbi:MULTISPECIES: MarR family winged helix-turn-helix transcriptional regulator [unclassified Mucilaginibacter]|uniref:MarR family winged helix-turn-helix transcriptional regulator n=1 Tax=unclassified Mucilaginibacter TaxID=2617802 RepID=UPI00138CC2DF|nr:MULTISPECIES: MarR family winged helix-turn-helix transcriptional regulator [unclassified Mucilaginibacter]MBB5394991.1 DNA-binding MarR family transcriptional regulator [Mucilaginibacter sp. AK015]QHS56638.1 winged helix-turn-helix transcriptional regulator [Mucilaginibacter sp. 14171R-50]